MKQPLKLAPFGTRCSKCDENLIVKTTDRKMGVQCTACGYRNGSWPNVPNRQDLPDESATLREIIRFSDRFNPLPHFQSLWGDEYKTRVADLWRRCIESFKNNSPPPTDIGELLMCLQFDIVLGPYLPVPDSNKLQFLQWLVNGIRMELANFNE